MLEDEMAAPNRPVSASQAAIDNVMLLTPVAKNYFAMRRKTFNRWIRSRWRRSVKDNMTDADVIGDRAGNRGLAVVTLVDGQIHINYSFYMV